MPCYISRLRHHDSRTRVRYKETDQMGIAHHANYIVWYEIGRTDLCRAAGFPYTEIERRGYLLVVAEVTCRYRTPFRYDDEVVIRTHLADLGSRAIRFGYQLLSVDGTVHAEGSSHHIWVDGGTRRPVRADGEVVAAFREWMNAECQQ